MDKLALQYNGNTLRTKEYKNINLYVVKDILRSIVDVPEEELNTYWKALKKQLDAEGFDIYSEISSFDINGTVEECVDRLSAFRIVQSIDSPQAESFKQWFAELAEARIEETLNPSLAIERAIERYAQLGYSPDWIKVRTQSIIIHTQLINEWYARGANKKDFEKLANIINKGTFGLTIQEHKDLKNVTDGSLKDNMSQLELVASMVSDVTAKELHKLKNSQGIDELSADAGEGAKTGLSTRQNMEFTLGKSIITSENALDFTKDKALE